MISPYPITLMSQETKYSLTSEYLGCNNSGDQMQMPFVPHHEQQTNSRQINQSQVNLNNFDVQSLFGQVPIAGEQINQEHSNQISQYQEEQQQHTLASMINEFSLMHDQQVDLLNQRRIRDRLERRSGSVSSGETFPVSRGMNNSNNNCGVRNPPTSPSSSSTTCFMTGNQVVLGLNSSSGGSIVSLTTSDQHSPSLASSSHQTPPDSPITDLCNNLTPSNPMTLANSVESNNPECNTISPETHHNNSFVTSSNGSPHGRRPRVYSIPGQVTSSTRVQLPVPQSPSSSQSPLTSSSTHIQEASSTGPFLRIIEQPTNRIRYRYKSEKGSHGGLTGENNSQSKKTYPTVKLENYKIDHNVTIMIKASLVTNEENPKPHVHKLMGRNCTPDGTCLLPLSENYTASFQNLGILFIGKKEVPDILYQRKLKEMRSHFFTNEEESINNDGQSSELERLREEAEREAKDMNLNCVKLSFQAFDCTIDPNSSGNQQLMSQQQHVQSQIHVNFPITNPVFSRPVANQKSPDSGELKIVRMDRNSGCVTGDEEVFLLCEKVNKKEIKVRFFEPDSDGNLIWESYGNFSESDVHHQVAIVLRTPAYRSTDVDTLHHVYLQLYRPKDGEYSEPRQFTYYPKSSYPLHPQQLFRSTLDSNKRRKLMSYHSSPVIGQHQIQTTMNQRCPNVNISTLVQSYLPHQQPSINDHCIQSMDTGLIASTSTAQSSHHSPTSTSSPVMSTAQHIPNFFGHNQN